MSDNPCNVKEATASKKNHITGTWRDKMIWETIKTDKYILRSNEHVNELRKSPIYGGIGGNFSYFGSRECCFALKALMNSEINITCVVILLRTKVQM